MTDVRVPRALTIAGSDSGGGAGIQADLKTFQELGVYGMSAITAITVQNTLGVHGVYPLPQEATAEQIEAVGLDLGVDALKTGMLFNAGIIRLVSEQIRKFGWKKVVVDPVMIAKGGAELLQLEAVQALKDDLFPLALVVTPNIPEAEALTGISIRTMEDRREAARHISSMGPKFVVIKGGHADESENSRQIVDLLFDGTAFTELSGKRVRTVHTHGTGCTFSAAITAELGKGMSVLEAISNGKAFIQAAIEDTLSLGQGHGPTNHWAYRRRQEVLR
ncbi:Hydroxymethylpyrimidine/phosphomethylpyrimidine kinase [Paenibacillus polymyxa E681]|uniref:bifunctional hydroxymethylpyrimidine kinase/phosphomethylpyrimidine kinase n=1 Tax=Paenibacillus polymyxa TaxID=1406 RepID=UPI0001E31E80|nr:bifunctional hydroxymethylpyrimidine kinase/phosphomethylpyrimidine kinase [Paenibacillus polymyxa]ADM71534.1 phosphomethylpyrimidine kinase [Paenibacillus polymyxa E681]QNV58553.1 Hydroxymethylpyrimidine/phosphomethylpyrimidine kinase [Paenibacillus polymyxa E681]QNV63388.1 Hydroxymethylpyrimidine/phosphomethylpyrimidine kinase [Paenibacillus polymyxa E681]